jgi:hypothetical protein
MGAMPGMGAPGALPHSPGGAMPHSPAGIPGAPLGSPPPVDYLRGAPPTRELADTIPGAVSHGVYDEKRKTWKKPPIGPNGLPQYDAPPPPHRPSGWNAPAFGMLAIFLVALTALVYPQVRARLVEHKLKPLVSALAQRPAGARCPRYITAVFTNVGSVSFDANGQISNHTDLTGPICDGMKRLYTPAGRAEMKCLVTDGRCSKSALQSVVALSTVTHESMHLRGILDEAAAECESITEGERAGVLAGLTPEEGRMIGYVHMTAMNPNTPPQYHLTGASCPGVAAYEANPPGTEAQRGLLTTLVEDTWLTLGKG